MWYAWTFRFCTALVSTCTDTTQHGESDNPVVSAILQDRSNGRLMGLVGGGMGAVQV